MRTAALCLLITISASAQVELQRPYWITARHFSFQALNFKSPHDQSRIDFYFQVPYSRLYFVKTGSEFTSVYTVTVKVNDKNDNTVLEESWDGKASCSSFDETNSSDIIASSQRHFIVNPGSYKLIVTLSGPEAEGSFKEERDVIARDYPASTTSISDIMILLSSSLADGKRTIVPNVQGNIISRNDSFPIFYEVYSRKPGDSVYVTSEITGAKDKILYSSSKWFRTSDSVSRVFESLPKSSLSMGNYHLKITLRSSGDKDGPFLAAASTPLTTHFPDLPSTVTDLDNAADAMIYIADQSTIDSIKSSADDVIKKNRFLTFWDRYHSRFSLDGRVSMQEYYNRVAYANEHFTHFFSGWKSDRGMIYILFGPPDDVERHPFNIDTKPYEIWHYYRKSHYFYFADETGFGDYRLLNPVWEDNSPITGVDFTRN